MLHAVRDNEHITSCGIALAHLWAFPGLDLADRVTTSHCPHCPACQTGH
jgi:hypothetical protein